MEEDDKITICNAKSGRGSREEGKRDAEEEKKQIDDLAESIENSVGAFAPEVRKQIVETMVKGGNNG